MKRSIEECHSDSDETRLSCSSEVSLVLPCAFPLQKEKKPRSSRSSIMMNLRGSVRLAPEFEKGLLPPVLRELQVYCIIDRSVPGPYLEPANNDLEKHYVVKRLVDETLSVSPKTIENYFRIKEDDTIKIGFVVHSKRFPQNTSDYLSASNEYLLISLNYLKDWYKNSLKVMSLVRKGEAERWPEIETTCDNMSEEEVEAKAESEKEEYVFRTQESDMYSTEP